MEEPGWWSKVTSQSFTKQSFARSSAPMDTAPMVWDVNSSTMLQRWTLPLWKSKFLRALPLFKKIALTSTLAVSKPLQMKAQILLQVQSKLLQEVVVSVIARHQLLLTSPASSTVIFWCTTSMLVCKNTRRKWRCTKRGWPRGDSKSSLTHLNSSTSTFIRRMSTVLPASRLHAMIALKVKTNSSSTVTLRFTRTIWSASWRRLSLRRMLNQLLFPISTVTSTKLDTRLTSNSQAFPSSPLQALRP